MLIFIPIAFAVAEDVAPCEGAWPTFGLPADGASEVSPDVTPVVGIDAGCGAGNFTVALTPDVGEVQSYVVAGEETGLLWLDQLVLEPDTAYVLTVVPEISDWNAIENHFSTGTGPVDVLEGRPQLEVIGTEFFEESSSASISLELTLVGGASPWELNAGDRVVTSGAEGGSLVRGVRGEAGDEFCFTLTQYQADGVEVGTSDEACVTLETTLAEACGCASARGLPGLGAFLALLALRRRR